MVTTVANTERLELMVSEGKHLVVESKKRGLHLRLLGAIAFQIHCPAFSFFSIKLNRVLTDIDFAAYGRERGKLADLMMELGYSEDPSMNEVFSRRRMIWENKSKEIHVDIFLDKLEMNHDIPFENRLEYDEFTIPLADLLLEKMQIVQINEKDIIDTMMLLREHAIGEGSMQETVDAGYISKLLSRDWGFYYTVTTNLVQVQNRLTQLKELTDQDRADIAGKIQELLKRIENEPKSLTWKMKAKVGPKGKWYRDVEEVAR
jgi:hypothetical protein